MGPSRHRNSIISLGRADVAICDAEASSSGSSYALKGSPLTSAVSEFAAHLKQPAAPECPIHNV